MINHSSVDVTADRTETILVVQATRDFSRAERFHVLATTAVIQQAKQREVDTVAKRDLVSSLRFVRFSDVD